MKKILALSLIALSFTSSAYAGTVLATHTPSSAGAKIYGGTTATEAANATNSLVTLSTGVIGMVNFTAANNLSTSYSVMAKHSKGSKIFGTANDSTNVYWKADPAGDFVAADVDATVGNALFGTGWTAY